MNWNSPRKHTVYEALSAIADERVKVVDQSTAHVYSTSGNKYYIVKFNLQENAIMSNDNMAYYVGEISYPMVAIFLINNLYSYDTNILEHFKNIKWKDINQKNKNDFMKSVEQVLENLKDNGVDIEYIQKEVDRIYEVILDTNFVHLGNKMRPPSVY